MKLFRKTIAVLLAAVLTLACGMIAGNAFSVVYIGDVDYDSDVTVIDATLIQRYLVSLTDFTKRQLFMGDVDNNGEVDVIDVTRIQRRLNHIKDDFYSYYAFDTESNIENFYADYESGMAMAGVPVTFCAAGSGMAPLSYEFSVNNTIVQDRSEQDHCTYTFPTAGTYSVAVTVYNGFDEAYTYYPYGRYYTVIEPYSTDAPVITSVHFDHAYNHYSHHTVTAHVTGGSTPYQYCYTVSGRSAEVKYTESKLGVYHVDDSAPEGDFRLTTGYVDASSMDTPYDALYKYIPDEGLSFGPFDDPDAYAKLTLTVTVRDANGVESAPYELTFKNEDLPG